MFNFPLAPPSASNFAGPYDQLFYTILGLSLFFLVVTFFFVIYYAVRYKEGTKADRSSPVYENMKMEIVWVVVPTVLGIAIFAWGAKMFADMRTPPPNASEIFVMGKQWMWHIQHPDGTRENNTLHVPKGKPVKLTMISQDVIHAFYIPAFRVQYMVVPGRYTQLWFTPTQIGSFPIFCNMYCGTQHSEMGGKVVVMEPRDYAAWLAANGNDRKPLTAEQAGERIFKNVGCGTCHGEKDQPPVGPTLVGLFGKTRTLTNGAQYLADETYIRESIMRAGDKITKGYAGTMPTYQGKISEEEAMQLMAYIRSGATSTSVSSGTLSDDPTPTRRINAPAVGALASEANK